MSEFEIDFSLEKTVGKVHHPMIKSRTLHLDADFLSYYVTFDDQDGELQLEDAVAGLLLQADTLREIAGCGDMCLHFTPKGSTKGGRYDYALQKPYQEQRSGKPKPRLLSAVRIACAERYAKGRLYNGIRVVAVMDALHEADDTLRFACEGNPDAVLWSLDKDLGFTNCTHLDENYGLVEVNGFGYTRINVSESKSKTKTLKGKGTKFFWSQLLLGDTADTIVGCARLSKEINDREFPNKALKDAYARIDSGKAQTAITQAALDRGDSSLGVIKVFELLAGAHCDRDALRIVVECYKSYYGSEHYSEFRGRSYSWYEYLVSEANMLWIKRWVGDTGEAFIKEVLTDV
jgi:hypothetical protein